MKPITYTDGCKKWPWKLYKELHWNIAPLAELDEADREKYLAENWEAMTGKKINKKEGAE